MRLIYILALLLIAQISFGQTFPKIEGIGRFKINKTRISIIDTIRNEFNVPLSIHATRHDIGLNQVVAELVVDTINTELNHHPEAILCKDARVFLINPQTIADITLVEIILVFYKDVLVSIGCQYNKEIENALKLKYGPPITKKEIEASDCLRKKDTSIYLTWKNNSIVASIEKSIYYYSDCEEQDYQLFRIEDTAQMNKVHTCRVQSWKAFNKRQLEKKKAKLLKDF